MWVELSEQVAVEMVFSQFALFGKLGNELERAQCRVLFKLSFIFRCMFLSLLSPNFHVHVKRRRHTSEVFTGLSHRPRIGIRRELAFGNSRNLT